MQNVQASDLCLSNLYNQNLFPPPKHVKTMGIWACEKRCSRLTRVCLYTPIYFRLTTVTQNCGCFYSVCTDE